MSECNIYKLIEEFINDGSDATNAVISTVAAECNTTTSSNNIAELLTPPQSPQNNEIIVIEELNKQQPVTVTEAVAAAEEEEVVNIKPNRPYSYYVATNFHPFINEQQQQQQTTPILQTENNKKVSTNLTIDINNTTTTTTGSNSKSIKNLKKKSAASKNKNRLSVSLTDIKKPNGGSSSNSDNNSSTNNQHIKAYASQNDILNSNQKLKQFEMTNSGGKVKVNRLNKLLRRLFTFNRKVKSSSPLSATPITMINQQQENDQDDVNHIQHINYHNDSSDNEETSRFVRFFTSFRANSASTNTYTRHGGHKSSNCTPVVAKKEIQIPVVANESQNLPHISLLQVNTSCGSSKSPSSSPASPSSNELYTQVVGKLKRIVDDCLTSDSATATIRTQTSATRSSVENNNNNNSVDNIPFIDDEENQTLMTTTTTTTTTANTSFSFDTLNSNELTFSNNKLSSSTKYDLTEDLVKKLTNEIDSYSTFDSIVNQVALQNNIDWSQIAIVFELVSRAVKHAGKNSDQANKIKQAAVDYIDRKYHDWIASQEGGWMSVPDQIQTASYKYINELHNINY